MGGQIAGELEEVLCQGFYRHFGPVQYENDDLMRVDYGDDYGIACCVSPMKIGKQMQFFGARANLAKCLLYAINGGRDERTSVQVAPKFEPITSEYLDYNEVMEKYEQMMRWLAKVYVNALKTPLYAASMTMRHTKWPCNDGDVQRIRATGIAGLSIVADSLAAIRDCKVKVIRDERGLAVDFEREGEYVLTATMTTARMLSQWKSRRNS